MFAEENGVNAIQILAHTKLCSRHFVPGVDYGHIVHRRRLTAGAVPSVVSNNNHKIFDHCIKQIVGLPAAKDSLTWSLNLH